MGEIFAGKGFCEFNYFQTSRSNFANSVTQLQNEDKLLRYSHFEKLGRKKFLY